MNPVDLTLYLVTDSTYHTEESFLHTVEEACIGGATIVQLREKGGSSRDYLNQALKVKEITDRYHIPLIIDDRIDIALACDAAGVHVGQSDLPVSYARRLLGPDKIVGATAKTVPQALEAYEQGADYLGVGAMFPTTTKVVTILTAPATLTEIRHTVPIPVVAIGGITQQNVEKLAGSGICGVAVISAIYAAKNIGQASKDLKAATEKMLHD